MARGVLTERPFRLLFAGRAISSLGDRLVPVALAFAVLDLTGSVTDLGLVIAAQTTPLVVLVLFGGVWADRLPRQLVMLASDCVRALAQATSALLLLTGEAQIWLRISPKCRCTRSGCFGGCMRIATSASRIARSRSLSSSSRVMETSG